MYRNARRVRSALVLAGVFLGGVPAVAQGAQPCSRSTTDPEGDAGVQTVAPVPIPIAPANTDITGVSLTYAVDDSGKPDLVARVTLAHLDRQVMPGFTRHRYDVLLTWGRGLEAHVMLEATFDVNGAVLFRYGHLEERTPGLPYLMVVHDGATTGRLIEGEDGAIEIDVPFDALELAGRRVTTEGAYTHVETGETADNELPPQTDYQNSLSMDYTTGRFTLAPAACALAPAAVPAVAAPPVTAVLPRLRSRRLRSARGRVRIPLACASTAPCEAKLRVGTRSVTVRMKPGSRTVVLVAPTRAQARRLKRGRRVRTVVRMTNGSARSSQRVTVRGR